MSAFRREEKKFLRRVPPPDYSSLISIPPLDAVGAEALKVIDLTDSLSSLDPLFGLPLSSAFPLSGLTSAQSFSEPSSKIKKAYLLKQHPGIIVIPNALSPTAQKELIKSILQDIAKAPNINNLDTHYQIPHDGLWNRYLDCMNGKEKDDSMIHPLSKNVAKNEVGIEIQKGERRKLIESSATTEASLSHLLSKIQEPPKPSPSLHPIPVSQLIHKLRWVNLGLLYHWDSKSYDLSFLRRDEEGKATGKVIKVPHNLARLATAIHAAIPWSTLPPSYSSPFPLTPPSPSPPPPFPSCQDSYEDTNESPPPRTAPRSNHAMPTFHPQSGIVNFYPPKSSLMGHVDQSEFTSHSPKPLISISLGPSAVFLIGGATRDESVSALELKSGDVLVMNGVARGYYHGVPRIIEGTLPAYLDYPDRNGGHEGDGGEEDAWRVYADFMRETRININIRQVFPDGVLETLLSDAQSHSNSNLK